MDIHRPVRVRGARLRLLAVLLLLLSFGLAGCGSVPMNAAPNVDIPRYMGDWYVLGHIPTSNEKEAWNGVESYRLRAGTKDVVEVTFSFRRGAFDGPLETMHATGYVNEGDPGRWGMHFYWWQGPFRFEYIVADVDSEYNEVVIGRSARDYVWIMARTPEIPEASWARLIRVVEKAGYDSSKIRRVPQRWNAAPDVSPSDRRPP
jgi:apolipoprotein D and lipocalin family protein